MRALGIIVGVVLIAGILQDAFETIVLPRRVARRIRFTRMFYRTTWIPTAALARRITSNNRRETFLGFFGPLSLILLISVWATGLIVGFAALHICFDAPLNGTKEVSFFNYVYFSGTTFFTLGFGDLTPSDTTGRMLAVTEAGTGFGFLALIIGYLPVIYQAFSRREAIISLLDARAGSPPSAAELIRRHSGSIQELEQLLRDWERWAADLMESHLSYPVLCYYRSQHNNQSWLTALTAVLDACSLVIVGIDGAPTRQAQLTFAMARHAVVDLAQIFNTAPRAPELDRLTPTEMQRLRSVLAASGMKLADGETANQRLAELRGMYEQFAVPLAEYLYISIPDWVPSRERYDNWQTSRWGRISGLTQPCTIPAREEHEDHF